MLALASFLVLISGTNGYSLVQKQASFLRTDFNTMAIDLGSCDDAASNFAVLAASTATFDGEPSTIRSGNVGVAPGTSITVATGLNLIDGTQEANTAIAIACARDVVTAYTAAMQATCPPANKLTTSELGGRTFTPGVYCTAPGTLNIAANLAVTLDADGDSDAVWIFQAASTLITGATTSFVLLNGAQAKNVFWGVGSSATLGSASFFKGTILASASITLGTTSSVTGRAYVVTAAVTCAGACQITTTDPTTAPTTAPTTDPTTAPTTSPTTVPTTPFPTPMLTPVPTPEPTECTAASCQAYADPHVSGFDNQNNAGPASLSLSQIHSFVGRRPEDLNLNQTGDFWFVKTDLVHI
jgi:hypothetical protein